MSITYPPEMLPSPDEGEGAEIIVCAQHSNCALANRIRTETIEECARVADTIGDKSIYPEDATAYHVAKSIRALSGGEK